MNRSLLPAAAMALLAASLPLPAQTATTNPVGVVTLDVAPKPAGKRGLNLVSLNMVRPAAFQAVVPVDGVSSEGGITTISFQSGTFIENQFNGVGNSHYVDVLTGPNQGVTSPITSTSTSQLALADDISEALDAGTTVIAIRPHWTLGTAFPNGGGLQSSTTATNADTVTIIDPNTSQQFLYFFHSNLQEWRRGLTPSNHVIIPPDAGLLIDRKSSVGGVAIQISGEVKTGTVGMYVGGNSTSRVTLIPNPYPIDSVTLGDSGLFTGNAETGVVGSNTATGADTVTIINPVNGEQALYFYHSASNQWRRGLTNSNHVVIPSGASIMVTRKQGRAPFVWYMPQPEMQLN